MQLTLSKRLAIGTGALLAIIFGTTAISVRSLSSVDHGVRDLSQNWLPSVQLAGAVQERINLARNFELLHVVAEAPGEMTELANQYASRQREAADLLAKYEEHVSGPEEREIYRRVSAEFKDYESAGARVLEQSRTGRKKDAAELVRGEVARMYLELSAEVDHLVEFNRKGADEAGEHADRVYAAARAEILGFAMAGLAVGVASALALIRSIRRPIARVVEALEAVADHDLSREPLTMTIEDEIGRLARATDRMCGKLKVIIRHVAASSDEVAAASTQVAAASEELATTVKTQEESASQVSSAVTELSSSVAEVATKATDASGAAERSRERADDGGRLVDRTVDQLGAITGRFGEAASVIAGLESQGAEVGRIAEVIEDIAEQTNLLALNAAIEAARAGEQGRGFAIVADEVRKLASRTAKATGEVSETIGAMRSGTRKAAETMEAGRATVEEGRTLGVRAGEAVRGIVQAQQGAEATSLAIAAASRQQASATEEIARSLEQMSAANAQSASAALQSSCAANALSRQAEELKRVIGQFKLA